MAHSNNHYGAPMGFCDNHGIGYVKSIGCADCNAKAAEAKGVETVKLTNNAVSVRIFPGDDLRRMANEKTVVIVSGYDSGTKIELNHCPHTKYYLFISKNNPNLLYTMLNPEQAMEITIGSVSKTTPTP